MTVGEILDSCEKIRKIFDFHGIQPDLIVLSIEERAYDIMRSSPVVMEFAKVPKGFAVDEKFKKPYFDINGVRFIRGEI